MTLPDPSTIKPGPPQRGSRWEWVPEATDGFHAWRVVSTFDGALRPCRWRFGRESCKAPAVAKLLRSQPPSNNWWHYCADHLYGRVVHDGRVWSLRLVPDEEGTR